MTNGLDLFFHCVCLMWFTHEQAHACTVAAYSNNLAGCSCTCLSLVSLLASLLGCSWPDDFTCASAQPPRVQTAIDSSGTLQRRQRRSSKVAHCHQHFTATACRPQSPHKHPSLYLKQELSIALTIWEQLRDFGHWNAKIKASPGFFVIALAYCGH